MRNWRYWYFVRYALRRYMLLIICAVEIFFIGTVSCSSQRTLSKEELETFILHSKELHKTQSANGFLIEASYRPADLMVWQELDNGASDTLENPSSTMQKVLELKKKYETQYYFTLSFSRNGKEAIRQLGSFERYSNMVSVFSFQLGSYILAIGDNKDTSELKDYLFEQNYGMSGSNMLLLAFDKRKLKNDNILSIQINEFGLQTGTLKFSFSPEALEKVPSIKWLKKEDAQ